jgi:hypothetical protein
MTDDVIFVINAVDCSRKNPRWTRILQRDVSDYEEIMADN